MQIMDKVESLENTRTSSRVFGPKWKKANRIVLVAVLLAAFLGTTLVLLGAKKAELTVNLDKKSKVAIVYFEVREVVDEKKLNKLKLRKKKAHKLKRGRRKQLQLVAGKRYTVLAVRKWEGKVYRFVENLTLPEKGKKITILPEEVELEEEEEGEEQEE